MKITRNACILWKWESKTKSGVTQSHRLSNLIGEQILIKWIREQIRRPSWRCRWPSWTRWRWNRTARGWWRWWRRKQSNEKRSEPFDEWEEATLHDDFAFWAIFLIKKFFLTFLFWEDSSLKIKPMCWAACAHMEELKLLMR